MNRQDHFAVATISRLLLATALVIAFTLPVAAQVATDAPTVDCDALYTERFSGWLTFFTSGEGQPVRPDRASDCYEVEIQAQGDAFAVARRSPSPPELPANTPPAVISAAPLPVATMVPLIAPLADRNPLLLTVRLSDLPDGFTATTPTHSDGPLVRSATASFSRSAAGALDGELEVVSNTVALPTDPPGPMPPGLVESALSTFMRGDGFTRLRRIDGPAVGDEALWARGPSTDADGGSSFTLWIVASRTGDVVSVLMAAYYHAAGNEDDALRLAELVSSRSRGIS
jgi:hypothetical protein